MSQPNSSSSSSAQGLPSVDALRTIYADKQVGELFEFGHYPQGANGEIEPIIWRVLQSEADYLLVIAEQALDFQPYHEECDCITWADCHLRQPYHEELSDIVWADCRLRSWLNDEFINEAFNEQERKCVLTTSVVNNAGPDIEDRVFLLSVDEAQSLFADERVRRAKPTEYTVAKGAHRYDGNGCCWWWLRSRGGDGRAACVGADGFVYDFGGSVNYGGLAVRPALKLAL